MIRRYSRIVSEGGHVAIAGLNEERLEYACSLLPEISLILKSNTVREANICELHTAIIQMGLA